MTNKFIMFLFLLLTITIYSKPKNEFEVNLPNVWMQVSKETVEFLVSEKIYPSKIPAYEDYDYLIQLKSNDTLFSFPYVLVQLNNSKRLTKSELKNYGSLYFKFDPVTNYLWKYNDSSLEVIIPKDEGTINVFCYASKNNFPVFKDDFKRIVNSSFVNPGIKYSSNFILDIPVLGNIIYSFNGTSIFLLSLLVTLLVTQKVKNKKAVK